MNTNNTTANSSTFFPDSWYDLWKLDQHQPLDFEAFLNSNLLAARRNHIKTLDNQKSSAASVENIF